MTRTTTPIVNTEIVYIPVKQLSVVWVQSQRPYSQKWAKTIAEDFDPYKFDPLIVTKPNGEGVYHIIEGQHRRHALEMYAARSNPQTACDERAPCRVVEDADPARAADIWLGINGGRKAVSPINGFLVAVVAGREPEVTINGIVINNGFHVTPGHYTNTISAVSALKTIYDRHGRMTLNNVLRTLRVMWKGDPAAVTSPMLRGFGIFIHEFGTHVDTRRLVIKVAARFSPHKLSEAAKTRKQSTIEKLDVAISELLLKEYNSGLKDKDKLKHKG